MKESKTTRKTSTSREENQMFDLDKEVNEGLDKSLRKIKQNEKKFRDELNFETDTGFYFQVVFKSTEDMKKFIKNKKIILNYGDFIFFDDYKELFK